MTEREALKLALDALENHTAIKHPQQIHYRDKAITAIKEALAQPEQEPVARVVEHGATVKLEWASADAAHNAKVGNLYTTPPQPEQEPVGQLLEDAFGRGQVMWFNKPKDESMLYTNPPQRTWVGLTDADIGQWIEEEHDVLRWAEAKLKEKNT